MIDRSPNPLFLGESPAAVRMPRGAVRAYLAVVAAAGGLATAGALALSLAANGGAEAGRIVGTQGGDYARTLASALTVDLAKPLR